MKSKEPPRCPYCGSIENNGYTCKWCLSNIKEYLEENNDGKNSDDFDSNRRASFEDR